jgi:hypothetical protein
MSSKNGAKQTAEVSENEDAQTAEARHAIAKF